MGIFGSSKKEGELEAVFDLGSSSVGGAVFWKNKEGTPKIIFSAREHIELLEQFSPEQFFGLTLKALDSVLAKVSASGKGAPKKIHIVLSSPWYFSQTRIIKFSKETPFVFNSKLADELMKKELALFREQHGGGAARPLEVKIMKTLINGYATGSPHGQKGTDLELTAFISGASPEVLAGIEEAVFRHFHSKKIDYSSFIFSSYAAARDFVHHEDFILIDIGGEVTDISLIKKDVLKESATFPMGRNFMLRGACGGLKCGLAEAKSLLSLYKDNHADDAAKKKIEPVVKNLKAEWLKKFQESLANLGSDVSIPALIFITVDSDLAEFFSDVIRSEQFNQYILTESKFKVTYLGTQELHQMAAFEDSVVRDPALTLETVYITRYL